LFARDPSLPFAEATLALSAAADSSADIFRFKVPDDESFDETFSRDVLSLDSEPLLPFFVRELLFAEESLSLAMAFKWKLPPDTTGGRRCRGADGAPPSCPPAPFPSLSDPLLLSFGKLNPKLLLPMLTRAELSELLLSLHVLAPSSLLLDVAFRPRLGFIAANGSAWEEIGRLDGISDAAAELPAPLVGKSSVAFGGLLSDIQDGFESEHEMYTQLDSEKGLFYTSRDSDG
jgi:hypothetical protein